MQSSILLEIQFNAVGIIESPVALSFPCRRKGKTDKPIYAQGLLLSWLFAKDSLAHCCLHSHSDVGIPQSVWPHCGVSDFSPLAFETLGPQHSCSLLECWNSEHRYKGVIVGQDDIIQMCKKDKKIPIFSFLDLYIKRSNSIHIFLCKEPEKGLSVVGWLWVSCFGKHIILTRPSTHIVLHRIEKSSVVLSTWRMEALMANDVKRFGYLADFKQIIHTAPYLFLMLCAYKFIHKHTNTLHMCVCLCINQVFITHINTWTYHR